MTIAMSCNLIDTSTEVLVIDEEDKEKLEAQMNKYLQKVKKNKEHDFSIFVVGDSLIKITEYSYQKTLVEIADHCISFVG
jgi:hypothetical protein